MKAKLKSGEIVELKKDCECITHDNPHWIHMDNLDKKNNRKMLAEGNVMGYIMGEQARLSEKLYQMESRGIDQLLNEPVGD